MDAIGIDFLSSLGPEELDPIGPAARVYDLQLQAERADAYFQNTRRFIYKKLEDMEREANASGRSAFGMSSLMEVAERDPALRDAREKMDATRAKVDAAQAEIGGIVFCPPVDSLDKIEKKLNALNKRAERVNSEPAKFTVTDERILLNYVYETDQERSYHADFLHAFVIVTPARPLVPGFEFIATIQHTEHGNIVRRIPAIAYGIRHNLDSGDGHIVKEHESKAGMALDAFDLSPYYNSDATCDHCHKIRSRNETFIVYNEAEGTFLQVGRTCLRDYTGIDTAEKAIKSLEQYFEIYRSMNRRGEKPSVATEEFMTHAAALIRQAGGYQKGIGWDAERNFWNHANDRRTDKGHPDYITPTAQDRATAKHIIKWAREWDEMSDFAQSVRVAVSGDAIPEKGFGLAAAAFVAKTNFDARETKRIEREKAEEGKTKGHIGTIKERITFQATVKSIKWIEDRYSYDGSKPLIIMEDAEGNEIKWFASNLPRVEDVRYDSESGGFKDRQGNVIGHDSPIEGATYEIKATVVEHEDHERFGKSTKVNRAKFLTTISTPQED